MSNEFVFLPGVLGFEVAHERRVSPTVIRYRDEPEAPAPEEDKEVDEAPVPDEGEIRRQILAEELPRAVKRAEQRVREEERKRYEKQRAEERESLEQAHAKALGELERRQGEALAALTGQVEAFIKRLRAEIASELVARSLEIATIILRHELPDRAMMASLLQETLEPISDLQGAKVRIHPDDLALLRGEPGQEIAFEGQFEWVEDRSLQPGDLRIESRNGIFDANLQQRLELLDEKLRQRVGQRYGDGDRAGT